jgi:5-oxoprolinase (ATP-hydrolysing)
VVEVDERVLADGTVERAIDLPTAADELKAAYGAGIRAIAIALIHGYRYPVHEKALAAAALRIGFSRRTCARSIRKIVNSRKPTSSPSADSTRGYSSLASELDLM